MIPSFAQKETHQNEMERKGKGVSARPSVNGYLDSLILKLGPDLEPWIMYTRTGTQERASSFIVPASRR